MSETTRFEVWGVVEVMGHQTFAGFISEQTIGGSALVRVDVPETDNGPAFSKLFGTSAIYSITPCSEAVVRMAAARTYSRPLSVYMPELAPREEVRALPACTGGDDGLDLVDDEPDFGIDALAESLTQDDDPMADDGPGKLYPD